MSIWTDLLAQQRDEALDDLLAQWHAWAQGDRQSTGYSNSSSGLSDWRSSRQYDFENGAIDAEVDRSICRSVDFQVRQMSEPYRSAIYMNAKNLSAGRNVFRSPRVPSGVQGVEILRVARGMLTIRLVDAGVI